MSGKHQRRRHPRIEAKFGVKLSSIDPEHDPSNGRPFFRSVRETCANVSRGGAFVYTRERFGAGRRVLLEFDLPGGEQIEALGRVAWTNRNLPGADDAGRPGIGIEFMGGASPQWKALDSLLERASTKNAR